MDSQEFSRLLRDAETKLAHITGEIPGAGAKLSRAEQVLLLAGLLLRQSTRKEKRYGQN